MLVSEKIPLDSAEDDNMPRSGEEVARTHSPETPEHSPTIEPPESIASVSEVVGIAEEQKAEMNMLGEMSHDLHYARIVLEKIKALDPEKISNERKAYIEDFIAETKEFKNEVTQDGVAILRSLPNAKEIDDAVALDDEATIAELTLRKKDKDQPLSKEEEAALSHAFKSRDRFFEELEALGIERGSARELYHCMLAEKTSAIRKRIPQEVDHARKIAEIKKHFESDEGVEQTGEVVKEEKDILTPFLTPDVLAAIEELNNQPTKKEAEERDALRSATDIEEIFRSIPMKDWRHQTPKISELASQKMIEALKSEGIKIPEGGRLTVMQVIALRRDMLGRRGTNEIAALEKHVAPRMGQQEENVAIGVPEAQVASETSLDVSPEDDAAIPTLYDVVPPTVPEGIEVKELDTEVIALSPVPKEESLPPRAKGIEVEELGLEEIAIPPVSEEASKEKTELHFAVAKQFAERFGMSEEVLQKIEGFTELSTGQQLLVLENFAKTAAQDVSVEGLKAYKEDLAKSGFFGRAWKNMTKQYQLGKAKGTVAKEWRDGESAEVIAMKKDTLEGLTKLALTQKEFDVIRTTRGLEIAFASEKLFAGKELSNEEKNTLARFNDAANRYANLDFSGSDKNQKELKMLAEKEYQTALESVTAIYAEHDLAAGVEWQHKVRSAIQMNRFFADDPELEKDLTRSAGMTAFLSGMNTLAERGTIAATGFGLRVAAVGALGTAGLFVAAPIVGGFLGARRAKQSIEEKDLLARMGERDVSDDAKHEGSMTNEDHVAKNVIAAAVLAKKLSQSLHELDEANDMQMIEVAKRDESGTFVRDAAGKVIKETVSKKVQLLGSLDARIEYTKRKIEEELVNLGGTNTERIAAINDLMEVLGHAEARVTLEDPINKNILSERLDSLLDIRKEKIEDNRKYLVKKEALKGAALATGFALAGTGIGWAVRHGIDTGLFSGGAKPTTLPEEALGPSKVPGADIPQPKGAAVATLVEGKSAGSAYESLVGRPVSETEMELLNTAGEDAGDDIGKGTLYGDLLEAVRSSKVPLSEIDLARIVQAHSTPEQIAAGGGPIPGSGVMSEGAVVAGAAARVLEATPKVYSVGAGDTLTSILKQHVSEVRALSSDGQENAIQNFLRSLSAEDLQQIGVGTDPNKLAIGQSLNLEKIVQLLHEKQVGGTDILKHAEILTTPRSGALEGNIVDMHTSGATPDVTPHSGVASVPTESATTTPAPRVPSSEEVLGKSGKNSVASEAQGRWRTLPESARLLEADTTARRYIENDISTLYGPRTKFGYFPREWTSISARNAGAVLLQTKDTDPRSLLAGADEIPPGYEWSVVNKMQLYIREQGFTKENGFVPREKESITDFIKRAHTEKIMREGPTRPISRGN